jgi:protein-tyrosine phosphatase
MAPPPETDAPVRIVFVCLGNICRSPTAEAVMRDRVEAADLSARIEIDSAGTGGWHVGQPADERARAEAATRGIAMSGRARQFHVGDFEYFDLIIAMDTQNRADLVDLAPSVEHRSRVRLLREFDPASRGSSNLDVPDPYYGGPDGFGRVFDLVQRACDGLLDHLRDEHLQPR